MNSKWKAYTLGDLCSSVSDTYGLNASRVVLLNTSDVLEGKIVNHSLVPRVNLKGQFKKIFKKNDILYSEIRPKNKRYAFVDIDDTKEYIASTKLMVIRPDVSKVEPKYLYYLLTVNSTLNKFQQLAESRSGTFPQITFDDTVAPYKVSIPSKVVQKSIVQLISGFDKKIDLNNGIIDNLEEQRSLLFRHKFIDNNKTGDLVNLDSLVEQTLGGDWGKETFQDKYSERVHCIRGADIPSVSLGGMGKCPERFITKKNFENKRIEPNMIVIELSGGSPTQSTGRSALIAKDYIDRFGGRLICTNFCKSLKVVSEYEFFFHEYWKFLYNSDVFFNFENGTTGIKNLDIKSVLNKTEIYKPNLRDLKDFNEFAKSVQIMQIVLSSQNQILEETRDSLLPKLITGELAIVN